MNYYERHLGDYARDTGHLSLIEHGVYTLLLDRYYVTEQGIPADQSHRLARARTDSDREAVDSVLADFFVLTDGVWINRRVEEELAKAMVRIETARANGKRGGRKPNRNPAATHREPSGLIPLNRNGTQDKAHQAPPIHLSNQELKQDQETGSPNGSRLPIDWFLPDEWKSWAETTRSDIDVDMQAQCFADYWHGIAGAKGRKADWQATWRNWIRRADAPRGNARAGPATGNHGGFDQRNYGAGGDL